jgi:hypothetical protein
MLYYLLLVNEIAVKFMRIYQVIRTAVLSCYFVYKILQPFEE